MWTSVDAISWSRVPHDEAIFGPGDDHVVNVSAAARRRTRHRRSGGQLERRHPNPAGLVLTRWFGLDEGSTSQRQQGVPP